MTSLNQASEIAAFQARTEWIASARPKQLRPSINHFLWLILAGRGWGKTRTGAQDIAIYALSNPDTISAVVAPTHGDLRRVCFNGPSGLLSVLPRDCFSSNNQAKGYSISHNEIRLFNGSKIVGYAAQEPERLRGPQFHRAWCDELAAWRYPEAFDQLMFGLRLGKEPKCVITTTPKPSAIIKSLVDRDDTVVTRGNTFENEQNLAGSALKMLRDKYEGTTLGRQELYAEILESTEGALWDYDMISRNRLHIDAEVDCQRVLVAIDPAVTAKDTSDETGIVVVGKTQDGKFVVLDDLSGRYSADTWGRIAIKAFHDYEADRIVAEVNNGGDLVAKLLKTIDPRVPYTSVHATRGKIVRAEPIAALYEQDRVHHIGSFEALETQMCTFTGERSNTSPDRLDALVWGLSELSKSSGRISWRVT